MIGLQNQDKSTGEGRQEYARKRKPEYYSSSSSSSELETLTKDEDSLPHACNKENINKNDKIQGYREQIAQIKKLISGTGHQYASKVADALTEPDTRPGGRSGASSAGRAAPELETNAHSQLGHQTIGDPAQANLSIRQSSKNQPSTDSNFVDSRTAAEPWVLQKLHQSQLYQEDSGRPRSPPTAPLESKYGRRRQCELLAAEDRRRSQSKGQHQSFEDARSVQRSSHGGARSGSYSVSGERAFQTTLVHGATGPPAPTASQLNTASWNVALTPSQAGSKLSSNAGPPMHLNDLHSQESALKPKHDPIEGLYMNHAQLLRTAQSKDPRNVHLYYSQNPEPQFIPAPLLATGDDHSRAQAQSLQSQNLDRQTRNLGPQTLKSSTDSFTQMQGDILRLQEKIRGLETRLNPSQPASSLQSPKVCFLNQLQQLQGPFVQPDNRRAFPPGTQGKGQDEQSSGYADELRALQLQQSLYQDMQRDMQIFDEATAGLPTSVAAQAELLQKKTPSTLATQPALGTTTSSMSTLSPPGAQNDFVLPLQRRALDEDPPKPEVQQSNVQQRGGTGGQTSLTTFGGDCQFSSSQIFQRSGQAHPRCDAGDTPEPALPSTGTLAPSSFSNIHGSQYPAAAHTAQSQPSLQHDSIAKSLAERKEHAQYHQVTAPGTDLVNISSLTQTQKELHGASCYTSTGYQGQRRSGLGRRGDESKAEEPRKGGKRRSGSGVPMTSRSHSRSVTTGHKGNLAKMRSNVARKSKTRLDGKLGRDHSKKKMQIGVKQPQVGHPSKQQRSRNRDEATQLIGHQSEEDRASYRTYNHGRSSHRSHKTLKSTKSQRLSRQQHLQSMRGCSQSQKKQPSNYRERSNLQARSQGSRRLSRTSKMSRHSEYRGRRRQSTAAKGAQGPRSGKAYSASDGNSGSYQHPDAASEHRQERKRVKNENFKLRQKLKVQEEANAELRLEIERLHEKLTYMDELHKKAQKAKIQYGKVLAQLESSEMIRMEQQDKIKELVNKVHKLKRQKRELQDKPNKQGEKGNRTGSIKLSASVAHFSKSKAEKRGKGNGRFLNSIKHSERAPVEAKVRTTKSQMNGTKKAYDTFQNNPSPNGLITEEQMGMINHEATQQLLQIQNLHHGLRTNSKSNSRTRKSAKKAAQIVGGRLVQDGFTSQPSQQQDFQKMETYINNAGLTEANGFAVGSGSCATNARPIAMTMPNSLVQLKPASKSLQKTRPAAGNQVDPCSALGAAWMQPHGMQEAMNIPAGMESQPKTGMASTLLSFNATEAPRTDLGQNRHESKSGSNGRSHGRLAGDNMPQNTNRPSASGFGGTQTWNPGSSFATKNQLDLSQQHIHQQADDLYIRYRRLRDLERACEEKSNSGTRLSPTHAQMGHFGALKTSIDQAALSASNHFSSHKGIEEYHARAQRAGRGRGSRQEPGLATEAEDTQPDTIVNIPIRTGLSSQQHETRHDARTALCDPDRSAAQDSSVRIEDLYQHRDHDGLDANYGTGEHGRVLKSRNGSKSGALSRELDLHSSGLSASEYRNMRASKASMRHNGLSKDTIGSLGGYARLKEAPPSVGRRDISSTAVDVLACLRPTATGTELKDDQARLSRLQDSAGCAEHRSSLGMLSNDTEQISRRYLNLTSHALIE